MSNGSHGKQFEKDLIDSFRSAGHWAERFRDNTWNNMAGSNISPPDMIAVINKKPVLIEAKAITTGINQRTGEARSLMQGSISTKRCEGHQLQRLLDFEQGGHGTSYVCVMYYTPRAVRRCAVLIPVKAWETWPSVHGSGSVRLDVLREHLPPYLFLKWVGRKANVGPYDMCAKLGPAPEEDITLSAQIGPA